MFVSVIFLRLVLAELQSRGIPARTALCGTSIREVVAGDSSARVPWEQMELLLARAAALADDPAFGLTMGQALPANALQVLSFLAMSSSTLRQALEGLLHHAPYVMQGLPWELREHADSAHLCYREPTPISDGTRLAADALLVAANRLLHWFCGQPAQEVRFRHAPPQYAFRYEGVFRCRTYFQQSVNGLVFARSLLDVPQTHGDASAASALHRAAARLFHVPRQEARLSDRVRGLLHGEELATPRMDRIARRFGMSTRNMRRLLAEEGVSLTALVTEARRDAALEALRAQPLRIKDTSARLGFSEPSAFHRAFKRWTGLTPRQYSRRLAAQASDAEPP